jgi:hypothetical protein
MRTLLNVRAISLWCCLLAPSWLVAQSAAAKNAAAGASYPEQAYLSDAHYINSYFGFSFELPAEAHLHPVPEPAARDASLPLLDLAGSAPADAQILIAAYPTAGGRNDDAKVLLREALDRELYIGVEELRGLSKASIAGRQFYLFETRRGIEQHMVLATTMGEYIVRVMLAAHDEKVVKRLETSFEHVVFFAPADAPQYRDAEAKPYDGPSISSHRLAVLENDPPAKHIDRGNLSGDFYENSMLGFSYRVPQGWSIEPEGAVQAAVDRDRVKQDMGRPRMGRMERQLVDACSRTLFSAWAKRPDGDGHIRYDDFGEVTISAMSLACFPDMKFPANANDRDGLKSLLAEYTLTHPIVDDMLQAKMFDEDGLTVVFLEGAVAFQVPDDELSRRLSLGIAITERRGYLVSWFFAAPHDEELRALTNQRASFDGNSTVTVARSPQPGGGVVSESSVPRVDAAPATNETAAAPAGSGAAQPPAAAQTLPQAESNSAAGQAMPVSTDGAAQSPTTGATGSSQSATTTTQPSLLRPGETMESQQGKGAPMVKKQP